MPAASTAVISGSGSSLAQSYGELAGALLPDTVGVCLFDGDLDLLGSTGSAEPGTLGSWLRAQQWPVVAGRVAAASVRMAKYWVTVIALWQERRLLGVFCVIQQSERSEPPPQGYSRQVLRRLKPCIDCLHRELAVVVPPVPGTVQSLSERTAELEWLFKVTHGFSAETHDRRVIEELLDASTVHLSARLGVLFVPERRMYLSSRRDPGTAELLESWQSNRDRMLSWAQRNHRPLVINSAGRNNPEQSMPCKILSVPVAHDNGRVSGILGFLNPPEAPDFGNRHTFLARHLGRQVSTLVNAQFDLTTGLYTRDGLEQMYCHLLEQDVGRYEHSLVYLDIDHLRVVNESHGFELGDELIVRIAELLAPPFVPEDSFAGRVAGDRFVLVLPDTSALRAREIASSIQAAVSRLRIGPAGNPIDASVSCGIAALVGMPQGLARAIASAEIACKMAKSHGRNRVELYSCDDGSIMRRQDNVVAVGLLRNALKNDGLVLYAQGIEPLQDRERPGGYEILMRMKGADGQPQPPGPLIEAASQYQLLPSVDRWVVSRALSMLAPFREMLRRSGKSFSINISGQALGDESFIQHLVEQLVAVDLPQGSVILEITEQAAVVNLERANDALARLRELGCRFALDDFGTGANSLTALKALQVGRVKIDGSFVRDILTEPRSRATVSGILELARTLSLETVAEYVESAAIADAVRAMGVDYAQGYVFGVPQPLEQVLAGMAQEEPVAVSNLLP